MRISRYVIVSALFVVSCASGDAVNPTETATEVVVTSSQASPSSTVPNPTSPTTELRALSDEVLAAVPTAAAPSGATCERYDPLSGLSSSFRAEPCGANPASEVVALTVVCPTDDCSNHFEVVIETAEPFEISTGQVLEGVDIKVIGTNSEIACTVRNSFGSRLVGCLDSDRRLTVPPQDIWVASDDGLRHVFGPGATFLGEITSISILISSFAEGPTGFAGSFHVIGPTMPGRHTPTSDGAAEVVSTLLRDNVESIAGSTPSIIDCVVDELTTSLSTDDLTSVIIHGEVDYSDEFVVAAAAGFERCDPILEVYLADFGEKQLTPECVEQMADVAAREFDWPSIVQAARAVAKGELDRSARDSDIVAFTLDRYSEFGCELVE